MGLASPKQLGKNPGKVLVDQLEIPQENLPHLTCEVGNQLAQLGSGLLHILHLGL